MQANAKIIALRRVRNSTNGNPRYEVTFQPDNGPVLVGLTKPDSMFAYNMPKDGDRAAITWRSTPTGRTTITLAARV